jgi:hypothetical protein
MAVELPGIAIAQTEQPFDDQPLPLRPQTVTAFVGRTQRGPLNRPVSLRGFDEFRKIFGGHCVFSFLSHALQDYFAHGGEEAVVVRVANRAARAVIAVPAGDEVLRLYAREPGAHEFLRVSIDYDGVETQASRFNLVVQRLARRGSELIEDQELFPDISVDESDCRFVARVLEDSRLVAARHPLPSERPAATRAEHPGDAIPYLDVSFSGSDGEELTDYDVIGSKDERTGLFALDAVEKIDLLSIPALPSRDLGTTAFLASERYCERRRAMLIWDPPRSWESVETALIGVRDSGQSSRNAIGYFPRLCRREGEPRNWAGVPACGAIAGMLARNDRNGLWSLPQTEDAMTLKGGLAPVIEVGERQAALLNRHGINVFARVSGKAFGLVGDVSMAGPRVISSRWQNLARRRLALFIIGTIERGTRWAADRAADQEACKTVLRQVAGFLEALRERGALAGRAEQAFFVRPAPPRARDDAPTFRVGIALQRPGEFLVYEVSQGRDGSATRTVTPFEAGQLAG